MRALDRKLLRDLWRMRTQVAAIALVVASGVALFVAMLATYHSLRISEDRFYREHRFAHVWADVSRAPRSVTREVLAIPGVAAVQGRIKQQAILVLRTRHFVMHDDFAGFAKALDGFLKAHPAT